MKQKKNQIGITFKIKIYLKNEMKRFWGIIIRLRNSKLEKISFTFFEQERENNEKQN